MSVVVIGAGSMIAGALRRRPDSAAWRYLSHVEALADVSWTAKVDCVINLAFDPTLKVGAYDESRDVDLQLARLLGDAPTRYIMASTRMVYGAPAADGRLSEDRSPEPVNAYGIAKLEAERAVASRLGARATILRLSNIFDSSEALGERRSFFGMALRRLASEGYISFDMSPFVARDFLPAAAVADTLIRIVADPKPGLFNLGAGFAVPTGHIAEWLIAGYGSGHLRVTDFREHDGFWLDMARARAAWALPVLTERDIRDSVIACGAAARSRP